MNDQIMKMYPCARTSSAQSFSPQQPATSLPVGVVSSLGRPSSSVADFHVLTSSSLPSSLPSTAAALPGSIGASRDRLVVNRLGPGGHPPCPGLGSIGLGVGRRALWKGKQ
jgi:hypothetical protein